MLLLDDQLFYCDSTINNDMNCKTDNKWNDNGSESRSLKVQFRYAISLKVFHAYKKIPFLDTIGMHSLAKPVIMLE